MLNREGLTTAVISDHVTSLQAQFLEDTQLADFALLNPIDGHAHARFLAFRGDSAPALHKMLEDQNVMTDVRGDVLRIGFALYQDREDVARLAKIIGQLI
jgi:kynureninase